MTEWFETFFDALAHDVWRALVPSGLSDEETDFLSRALGLGSSPSAPLLDVPCGDGRLALRLAARGHRVVGVDLSSVAVDRLRAEATTRGLDVDARRGDMRRLSDVVGLEPRFGGAWCMGNSFGYLDREATVSFVAGVARVLLPGACFVVEAATVAEIVLPRLEPTGRHAAGDTSLTLANTYDVRTSTLVNAMTIERGGERAERIARHRVMTSGEVVAMLENAGFTVVEMSGGTAGDAFTVGAARCLITARRRRRP